MRKTKIIGALDNYKVGDRFEAIKTADAEKGTVVEISRFSRDGHAIIIEAGKKPSIRYTYSTDIWYYLEGEKEAETLRDIVDSM